MAFFFSKVKTARPSYGILKASTNALMPGNPHESPEYEIINKSCGALVQTVRSDIKVDVLLYVTYNRYFNS